MFFILAIPVPAQNISAVPMTTFGALIATASSLQEDATPAPLIEYSTPAPAVNSQSSRSAVEAFAPHVVKSSPFSVPTQSSREERDAMGRAVVSRLGMTADSPSREAHC